MPLTQDQMGEVAMDIFVAVLMSKKMAERESILACIPELVTKYALEIGENMNAAFNVATDLLKVIRQKSFSSLRSEEACSAWLNRVTRKSFMLSDYLQHIDGIEERLLTEQVEEVEEERS
jgi:iron-sulfur cluster repair protein YtfE (RIC family)